MQTAFLRLLRERPYKIFAIFPLFTQVMYESLLRSVSLVMLFGYQLIYDYYCVINPGNGDVTRTMTVEILRMKCHALPLHPAHRVSLMSLDVHLVTDVFLKASVFSF